MVSQILLNETLNPRFFLKIFILSTSKTAQRFDLSQFWASFWKKIEEIRGKSWFFSRTQTALTFDKNKWKYSLDIQLKGLPKGRLNPRFFLKIFILATSRAVWRWNFQRFWGFILEENSRKSGFFSTQSALHTDYKKLTVATTSLSHGIADSIEGNSEPEVYRNNFHSFKF